MPDACIVALALALCGTPADSVPPPVQPAAVQPADAWLGSDKFRHVGMSWAVTAFGFATARAAGADTDASLRIAVPVAAVVGIGKEIHDRRRGGIFSARDLVADAVGIAAAFFLLGEVR